MKPKEKHLSHELFGSMGNAWHGQRHEDKHAVGIPDISFSTIALSGWIELKVIPRVTKQNEIFDFSYEHLTPQQRNWMTKRCRAGSHCWLYCGVGPSARVLWYWPTLAPLLGVSSYAYVHAHSSSWLSAPSADRFLNQAATLVEHYRHETEQRGTPRNIR